MIRFSIEYNPYLVQCVFKKNGKVLNANSKIGAKSGERLQVLLSEGVNWKGLLEEIACSCDDDEVEIYFKGRKIDFDDLKYTIDLYKPESVNHLGEIFSENLKILCLWRYVFLQCFHPIVKKYLESYNPKTLAVIRFLAHFHLLGSRIQVKVM